eukprot:g28305.t1
MLQLFRDEEDDDLQDEDEEDEGNVSDADKDEDEDVEEEEEKPRRGHVREKAREARRFPAGWWQIARNDEAEGMSRMAGTTLNGGSRTKSIERVGMMAEVIGESHTGKNGSVTEGATAGRSVSSAARAPEPGEGIARGRRGRRMGRQVDGSQRRRAEEAPRRREREREERPERQPRERRKERQERPRRRDERAAAGERTEKLLEKIQGPREKAKTAKAVATKQEPTDGGKQAPPPFVATRAKAAPRRPANTTAPARAKAPVRAPATSAPKAAAKAKAGDGNESEYTYTEASEYTYEDVEGEE